MANSRVCFNDFCELQKLSGVIAKQPLKFRGAGLIGLNQVPDFDGIVGVLGSESFGRLWIAAHGLQFRQVVTEALRDHRSRADRAGLVAFMEVDVCPGRIARGRVDVIVDHRQPGQRFNLQKIGRLFVYEFPNELQCLRVARRIPIDLGSFQPKQCLPLRVHGQIGTMRRLFAGLGFLNDFPHAVHGGYSARGELAPMVPLGVQARSLGPLIQL